MPRRKKPHEKLQQARERAERMQKAKQQADAEHPPSVYLTETHAFSYAPVHKRALTLWEKVRYYGDVEKNGLKRTHD